MKRIISSMLVVLIIITNLQLPAFAEAASMAPLDLPPEPLSTASGVALRSVKRNNATVEAKAPP